MPLTEHLSAGHIGAFGVVVFGVVSVWSLWHVATKSQNPTGCKQGPGKRNTEQDILHAIIASNP